MELQKRNSLIEQHIPWVKKLAEQKKKDARYPQVDVEELISVGNKALVEIAGKYCENKGPFEKFAQARIIDEMTNEVRRIRKKPVFYSCVKNDLIYYDEATGDLFNTVSQVLDNPTRDEQVLRWHFEDGLTCKEIGNRLGLNESQVSQLLGDYKRRIRENFAETDLH